MVGYGGGMVGDASHVLPLPSEVVEVVDQHGVFEYAPPLPSEQEF